MSTEFAEDAATDRLVRQLNEDSETLTRELSRYRVERASAVKAQNMALAAYDAEMAEIMGEADLGDAGVQRVDHQVLRHLNIERDSDLYKKFEAPSEKMSERLIKNIEEIAGMSANAGTENRALSMEEKGAMRERMFGLLDESRMEETRLELEHEQAVEQGNRREAEEIAEALYLLQREHAEQLADLIGEYRPAAFSKAWGNDTDYAKLVKNLATFEIEDGDLGNQSPKRRE